MGAHRTASVAVIEVLHFSVWECCLLPASGMDTPLTGPFPVWKEGKGLYNLEGMVKYSPTLFYMYLYTPKVIAHLTYHAGTVFTLYQQIYIWQL